MRKPILKLLTAQENAWLTCCRFVGIPAEPGLRLFHLLHFIGLTVTPPTP